MSTDNENLPYSEVRRIAKEFGFSSSEVSAKTQVMIDGFARAIEKAVVKNTRKELDEKNPLPGADWTIPMRRMMTGGKCSKRECKCKAGDEESCIWWDKPEEVQTTKEQLVIPQGWKLVPIEPTVAMLNAYINAPYSDSQFVEARGVYEAMLSATPAHPIEQNLEPK